MEKEYLFIIKILKEHKEILSEQNIIELPMISTIRQRLQLDGFRPEVMQIAGMTNTAADAISRIVMDSNYTL